MKYIDFDDHFSSAHCFALEEYIMKSQEYNDEYFLFWRTRPTLMIGRFQNTIQEINSQFVRENNIDIVRRNSGGGTIYTDENCWQFSFITWKNSGNVKDFRDFTRPVVSALKTLGVDAEFSGRNDLMVGEKKFSGNAQFGLKNRFLHHGAILFDTNLDNLVKALNVGDEKIVSKGIKSVRERVTNIRQYFNDPNITSTSFRDKMISLLKQDMDTLKISEVDLKEVEKIEKDKFLSWDWNFGNSPKFNISKSRRFEGGKLEVLLNVKNGIIIECSMFGDFFCSGEISVVQNSLIGVKYDRNDILKALVSVDDSTKFYLISIEDLLSCIID